MSIRETSKVDFGPEILSHRVKGCLVKTYEYAAMLITGEIPNRVRKQIRHLICVQLYRSKMKYVKRPKRYVASANSHPLFYQMSTAVVQTRDP